MSTLFAFRHRLAEKYLYARTLANIFRLHELSYIRRHLKLERKDLALDIACGIGLFTNKILGDAKTAVGMDISEGNIMMADYFKHNNTFFYHGNAEQLSHLDDTFDIVISICALEHFSDTGKALGEMYRVLKPGGQLLITVDSLGTIKSQDFIEFHKEFCMVNRYFTLEVLKEELENVGFIVEDIKALLRSAVSMRLCMLAFKIMKYSLLFNAYSCLAYPISVVFDIFNFHDRGITIAATARKKAER